MTKINDSAADRALTMDGNYSKSVHRNEIARAKRRYLHGGGQIGVYPTGARWNTPQGARRMLPGKNREIFGDVSEYVETVAARVAAAKAIKAEKMAQAMADKNERVAAYAFNTADGREGPDGMPAMVAGVIVH